MNIDILFRRVVLFATIAVLAMLAFLIMGCKLSRQVQKEAVKSDSTASSSYDSTWLRKVLEQSFEARKSTTTNEKGVTLQPIIVEGKTHYVPTPYERNTTDNSELINRLLNTIDSQAVKQKETITVAKSEESKKVDAKAGPDYLTWGIVALSAIAILGGSGFAVVLKKINSLAKKV